MTAVKSYDEMIAKGYKTYGDIDPFENMVGPYFYRHDEAAVHCVFNAEPRHMNASGSAHGGMLMSFADFCLFMIASHHKGADVNGATVAFNSEFVGAGKPHMPVEGTGEVTRETGSMVFVRGTLSQSGEPLLSFSGIIRKFKSKS